MCRIVIVARSAPVTPRPVNPQRQSYYQRGDVADIVADGVFLGADIERGYPLDHPDQTWWRIVELPGVSATDPRLIGLLARDPGNVIDAIYVTDLGYRTWKRDKNIDLDALEAFVVAALGRPLALGEKITVTKALDVKNQLVDKIQTKIPMPRSGVIG